MFCSVQLSIKLSKFYYIIIDCCYIEFDHNCLSVQVFIGGMGKLPNVQKARFLGTNSTKHILLLLLGAVFKYLIPTKAKNSKRLLLLSI